MRSAPGLLCVFSGGLLHCFRLRLLIGHRLLNGFRHIVHCRRRLHGRASAVRSATERMPSPLISALAVSSRSSMPAMKRASAA